MEVDKVKLTTQLTESKISQEYAESELQKLTRQMLELTSKSDKDTALLQQENDHLKKTECELRSRETVLTQQLKEIQQSKFDESKERELTLQKACDSA